jgi:formylmethanofuran dehydrogenase subunit C
VSEGLTARLRSSLTQRLDCAAALAGAWANLTAAELAQRTVELESEGPMPLGELFDIGGTPDGSIRLIGDLGRADRIGAGLSEGRVVVEGNVGNEAGLGMSGGSLDIEGNAGTRTGAAAPGLKRGMSGGELIVRGATGPEAGASMRRGVLVVGGRAGERAGLGMIAGNVIMFGRAGDDAGLWSKRGSVAALGGITPPVTYAYACTYQPPHLRLMLLSLQSRYGLKVRKRQLSGVYRRYSGDFSESGKGEILEWAVK